MNWNIQTYRYTHNSTKYLCMIANIMRLWISITNIIYIYVYTYIHHVDISNMLQSYLSPRVITNWIHGCFWAIQTVSCRVPGTPGGPPQCVLFGPGFFGGTKGNQFGDVLTSRAIMSPFFDGLCFSIIILLGIINHYCFINPSFWKWERGSFDWRFKHKVSKAKAGMLPGLKAPVISSFIYSNLNQFCRKYLRESQ